jgi:plastocyanin
MKARIAVAGAVVALVAAPPALAANANVNAVDGATPTTNAWSPSDVTVNVGETVTWHFDSVGSHNLQSDSANWSIATENRSAGAPPATYTFSAEGTYLFRCGLHNEMRGSVTVGSPPPPPPPPLSEQPFANDQAAPSVFEVTDHRRPRVTRLRTAGLDGAARVRFRLSEPGRATIRLERGSRGYTRTITIRHAGRRAVVLRGLAEGRYRVEVQARDLGGNRSQVKHTRVTVR